MWHWNGMGVWGWTMMVAFWLIIIALAIWGIRSTTGSARSEPARALQVLDERFARGEIDQEEYLERRRVLESHH
ncbi:MAG: SHOCT domain-containing protein [Actinomycetota bacterium]